ncbi:hypothetical protein Pcinc_017299 [Petrolisthes cinctipes]|uniref:Lipocalin/cytosolic fatty-acid binding domain-containing protein n=1 Tax=Petrolisthes cinctipes TaxID=88211 RepID=A0AAE1FPF3_PETCI|nr:hypothetical protein Pcinc_017299 [Petrolisthes cinctipes]
MLERMLLLVVVVVMVGSGSCHELFLGDCPVVPALQDFDMERFEGLWYMVESFDHGEYCVTWNITKGAEKGTWYLLESETTGAEATVGLSNGDLTTATLTPRPGNEARMTVNWPLNIAGSYSFTVHVTDYTQMAGVFQCQEIAIFQRQKGIVLSRTPLLKANLRYEGRLRSPGVKVEYYEPVQQGNCGRPHEERHEGAGSDDPGPLGGTKSEDDDEEVDNSPGDIIRSGFGM